MQAPVTGGRASPSVRQGAGRTQQTHERDRHDTARSSRLLRWPLWLATRLALPMMLLAAIGFGVLYVRLLNGPISLKPLAGPIARAIAADLPGIGVRIEDATVQLSDGNGLEFRLNNVRFNDADGAPVALAPLAAVRLSTPAMWSGKIAPSQVVLIEPRLLLLYSPEQGLSVSFARAREPASNAARQQLAPGTVDEAAGLDDRTKQIEVGRTIAGLVGKARQSSNAASYLRGVGLRNATVIFDNAGQQVVWRVSEADFGFDHRRQGSRIGGDITFATSAGPWRVTFAATSNEANGAITVDTRIADLVPRSIAGTVPDLAPLAALDMPVSGSATLQLSASGELEHAKLELDVKAGSVLPSWKGAGRLPIDTGRIGLIYRREQRLIELLPSKFTAGANWATYAGTIALPQKPSDPWLIDAGATEGMVAATEFGIAARPLDALRVKASYDAAAGNVQLLDMTMKVAGGEISLTGTVPSPGSQGRLSLQGRMTAMTADAAKLLWPSVVAPSARAWTGRQVQQARVTSGNFTVEDNGPPADRGRPGPDRSGGDSLRTSVTIELAGVRLIPKAGFAPIEAPRALVRVDGAALEIAAPDGFIVPSPQRRLPVKGVRMVSADVGAASAMAELTFRAQGGLPAALELMEQHAARAGRNAALPGEGIDGKVEAAVRILVPLGEALTADDTKVEIKGRATDGKARAVMGSYDVNGATIAFEITEQSAEAKGEMLLGGVNTKIAFQRIFAATENEQPPLRLSANLDAVDRAQLGIDINDIVSGDVPVEILVTPRAQGDQIQLRANLTNAELLVEGIAWRKAAGRAATLQFDVARMSKQRTELQGFKIVGDDIALSGVLVLDARNRLREFSFPDISLNVVSRLSAQGTLKGENTWDVTVKGTTFDGRDFFQSLFSVGQLRDKPLPPRKDQSGLDLKADIDNVLGHHELALKGLRLSMSRRGGRMVALSARGVVDSSNSREAGKPLDVGVQQSGNQPRRLVAQSDDAGQVMRLVGFYPNMQRGRMRLDVNLDGSGPAEKTGLLYVERFAILGDPVTFEAPKSDTGPANQRGPRRAERQVLEFDTMRVPFSVGHGQFVMNDADLRGQVLGVVLKGTADFRRQTVDLGGTYVPLQGLNSAIGAFPILGQILAGPRGEGVFGMTFAVQGPMSRPQVFVNPASILPGILREMTQMTNPTPRVVPRDDRPAAAGGKGPAVRSSASPAEGTQPAKPARSGGGAPAKVEADGGWSSGVMAPGPAGNPVKK